MLFLVLTLMSMQHVKTKGFCLVERVEVDLPGGAKESFANKIWVAENRVRSDLVREEMTLIYDLDLHVLFVIDHKAKTYQISRTQDQKRNARMSLRGLAPIVNGTLQRKPPFLKPTGARKIISEWVCEEFRLDYPEEFGVDTRIWASFQPPLPKAMVKKIWYAALGTSPPGDVRYVINEILRELRGVPIQITSTISLEGQFLTTTSTLISIRRMDEADADAMAIPGNYRLTR